MPSKDTSQKKFRRLKSNYYNVILVYFLKKKLQPPTRDELIDIFKIPEKNLTVFDSALDDLIQENKIYTQQNRYFRKIDEESIATGILRMHPRGFGFLQPDNPILFPQDIFIPKHLTKNAVDGDKVEVHINLQSFSEKGPEGKVISILSRSRTHIAGTVYHITQDQLAHVFVPLLGRDKMVHTKAIDERPLKVGDRLILKVLHWGNDKEATQCEMSHYIGHISDPKSDISAAIEEYELRSDFPSGAILEAQSFGNKVSLKEIKQRVDLRNEESFTIDPDTAKDFDDALSLKKDIDQNYILSVHIADVSHYVTYDSHLDFEAKNRCNSTYFPGFCLPMLPHELSSELCSLKPKVNRLTLTVEMRFDKEGSLLDYKIYKSVIKSKKRFTYKEAKKVLDGKKKSPYKPTLDLMVELCALLKKQRFDRGSIEFALSECVMKVDETGQPMGFETVEYDITHQLVEEFMLKANETVATHLTKIGKGLTYRVHDAPSEDSLKEFAQLARAFGFKVPKTPTQQDFQQLFSEAKDTPYASHLATSYIRSMKLAYYSPLSEGHFGLSLDYYCHFTSPIRRYVDLVVHRIVTGDPYDKELLSSICHACSEQERLSAKAEQSVVLLKKMRYFKQLIDQDPNMTFNATVTRVKNMGIIFEIDELKLDSFLHVSELGHDYFVYNERSLSLVGNHSGYSYACGSSIKVCLEYLDFITLESKWKLYTPSSKNKKPQKNDKKEKKKRKEGKVFKK